MANGHGGARSGSGRPRKPLADNLLEGNPGKRPIQITSFTDVADLQGAEMPPPRDFMSAKQRDGIAELQADDVYKQMWEWLAERSCDHLIPPQLIEQYAMCVARWIQCEEAVSTLGFLAKHPTTGNAQLSPYVTAGQNFLKQANTIWYQIYQVVRENCATEYAGSATPHDDMMERLLNVKRG